MKTGESLLLEESEFTAVQAAYEKEVKRGDEIQEFTAVQAAYE